MTLSSLLEKDKEQLLHDLEAAGSPRRAQDVLRQEMERLLYQYNEESPYDLVRAEASDMMRTASTSLALVSVTGSYTIWNRQAQSSEGKSTRNIGGNVLLIAGMILEAGGALLCAFAGNGLHSMLQVLIAILMLAGGGGCLFFSGRARSGGKQHLPDNGCTVVEAADASDLRAATRVEETVDPQAVYTVLQAMMQTIDRNLSQLEQTQAEKESLPAPDSAHFTSGKAEEGTGDGQQLALASDLLEALYSEDGTFALERLREITDYLHLLGIDIVDYSEEREIWFDRMPSQNREIQTVRPALARNGELLKKGLITGG